MEKVGEEVGYGWESLYSIFAFEDGLHQDNRLPIHYAERRALLGTLDRIQALPPRTHAQHLSRYGR